MGSITVTFLSLMFPLSSASFPPPWGPGSIHPLSVYIHYGAQPECRTRQNVSDAKVKLRYAGPKDEVTRISARILLDAIGATLRDAAAAAARAGACSYFGSATIASWEVWRLVLTRARRGRPGRPFPCRDPSVPGAAQTQTLFRCRVGGTDDAESFIMLLLVRFTIIGPGLP